MRTHENPDRTLNFRAIHLLKWVGTDNGRTSTDERTARTCGTGPGSSPHGSFRFWVVA